MSFFIPPEDNTGMVDAILSNQEPPQSNTPDVPPPSSCIEALAKFKAGLATFDDVKNLCGVYALGLAFILGGIYILKKI